MRQLAEGYRTGYRLILTAAVAVLALIAPGCQKEAPPDKTEQVAPVPPIVIMYAFDEEGVKLRHEFKIAKDTTWAGRRIEIGWHVQPIVLVSSGVGMSNAAATTQYVIDRFHPAGIVFTGICGSLDTALKIGDVAIPAKWITHDFGYWGKNGFVTDSMPVGRTDTAGFANMMELTVDTFLYRQLCEAADRIDFRFRMVAQRLPELHIGVTGVSGDAFIDSKSKREQLHRDFGAQIVDMESAAVVQTARANGVPVVVIRSCSDLAGGSGSETASAQLEEFYRIAADNSARVVRDFVENVEW